MTIRNTDPYFDAGMRAWIAITARRNLWKVAGWYDYADLVQDGYLCYAKCRDRYTSLSCKNHPSQDDRKHMMALVMTTFERHIINLARARTASAVEINLSEMGRDDQSMDWDDLESVAQPEEATLSTLLAKMPAELVELAGKLAEDASEIMRFPRKKGGRFFRETTNDYFCRLLNLDPQKNDIRTAVRDFFTA